MKLDFIIFHLITISRKAVLDLHLLEFLADRRDDPYNLEQLHSDEHLHAYINSLNALRDPLFKRHENRIDNTNFADFLHGNSLRFQDFTFSVLKAIKNLYAPLCLEYTARPDSAHHQLFGCPNFQSESRSHLCASIGNLKKNSHLPIIFHTDISRTSNLHVTEDGTISSTCSLCETRRAFKHQVKHVFEKSQFQDKLLSR